MNYTENLNLNLPEDGDQYDVELFNQNARTLDRNAKEESDARADEDAKLRGSIDAINAVIPSQATSANQLADKDFVNSSISTSTAYFIGTFDSLAALKAYAGTKTNNDYAFVRTTDSAGNTIYNRYKWNGSAWEFEYSLNNSSFTENQWKALNSGATAAKINQIKGMAGATASDDGEAGFVPKPPKGANFKFLRGDGTWADASSATTLLQAAFDAAHPVGSTYVQFPQQEEPKDIFNKNGVVSTWSMLDYNGAFFRASGGNAEGFKTKWDALTLQEASIPNVTFKLYSNSSNYTNALQGVTASGAAYVSKTEYTAAFEHYGHTTSTKEITMDASRSSADYGRREELAPANHTIRIWKRTA